MDPFPPSSPIESERLNTALLKMLKAPEGNVGRVMVGVLAQIPGIALNFPGIRKSLLETSVKTKYPGSDAFDCTGLLYHDPNTKSGIRVIVYRPDSNTRMDKKSDWTFEFVTSFPQENFGFVQDFATVKFSLRQNRVDEGIFTINESGRVHAFDFVRGTGGDLQINLLGDDFFPPQFDRGNISLPPLLELLTKPGAFLEPGNSCFQDMLRTFMTPPAPSPAG